MKGLLDRQCHVIGSFKDSLLKVERVPEMSFRLPSAKAAIELLYFDILIFEVLNAESST